MILLVVMSLIPLHWSVLGEANIIPKPGNQAQPIRRLHIFFSHSNWFKDGQAIPSESRIFTEICAEVPQETDVDSDPKDVKPEGVGSEVAASM